MHTIMQEYFPDPLALLMAGLVVATLLFTLIAALAVFFIWAERKVAGRIQDRLGPTRVGGRFGWLQTIADGIKLLTKEDTIPAGADRVLFYLAPLLTFVSTFVAFLVLPFSAGIVGYELNIAVFFMLAVLSSEVFGIILAGYASASKWSMFGGLREAAQVVSYEVPRALCVLVPVMIAGTLNLNTIGHLQQGAIWNWTIFHDPFAYAAFFIFFVCATASCKRAPFDLAEAESELVAGFHTEYSGLRWSIFFLAEYASMFAAAALAVLLFLGGWHTGIVPGELSVSLGLWGHLINIAVFIAKCFALVFVMMWIRWSLPRLRIDQVMMTCLKYFLPISCVLFVGAALWQLLVPAGLGLAVQLILSIGTLGGLLLLLVSLFRRPVSTPPSMTWSAGLEKRESTASPV